MGNSFFKEIIIAGTLLVLILLLTDPFGYFMPEMGTMVVLGLLVVAFAVFASFLWRESPRDEREGVHRMFAGRVAFLAGSAVLLMGIVVQVFRHTLDPWLLATLAAMVLAKIAALVYGRMKG